MNVLSLFDGMSCGQIALNRAGIKYDKYYASEIDKPAIAQTQLNFPNTVQLGSVVDLDVSKLEHIDLIVGGSPCQSFSFAGKRKGMSTKCDIEITRLEQYLELKEQGFEFEGQSYLFWEYMRILNDIRKYNPEVLFLLENVEMGAKWERVLSEAIGVYGVHINSALVSAQNRKRIYWTNIRVKEVGMFGELYSDIPQPDDKSILLKDILEREVDEKYYVKSKSMFDFVTDDWRLNKLYTQINGDKALPQMARQYLSWCGDYIAIREAKQTNPSLESGGKQPFQQNRVYDSEGISPALFANKADLIIKIPEATSKGYAEIKPGECFDFEQPGSKTRRGRKMESKSNSLMSQNMSFMYYEPFNNKRLNETISKNELIEGCLIDSYNKSIHIDKSITVSTRINASNCTHVFSESSIRRLTPTECARLQTIPSWYKWNCSDTQQYKMLGNGWTVDVIAHIFSFLKQ